MMHRLLNARNIYPSGFYNIPPKSNSFVITTAILEIKCSFCQNLLQYHGIKGNSRHIRHHSTKTASALQKPTKKKVKYKNYKKYGEVLEVNDKTMTESKVSISKLNASYFSKLASSSVSLGQLHRLTVKNKSQPEVDPELLQQVKNKILNTLTSKPGEKHTLEDDQCTLIFTSNTISKIEDRLRNETMIHVVKNSYENFCKASFYNQRLDDLRYAITEGLDQELAITPANLESNASEDNNSHIQKGAHAVFREIFYNNAELCENELDAQFGNLKSSGLSNMAIEELIEEISHNEFLDGHEELENEPVELQQHINSLKIKKVKQEMFMKRKQQREKRHSRQEAHMKVDMTALEKSGRQDTLHKQLLAHLQLLCSLDMITEGRQILQYYRTRKIKAREQIKVTDIRVYNALLIGYASKGSYKDIEEVLSYMEEDGIQRNSQTFATIFECIERSPIYNKIEILRKHHEDMATKGISLNDLLDKCKFLRDQREVVIRAIHHIDPHFEPIYTKPTLDYDCPLLDKLNFNHDGIRNGLNESPAKGLLSLKTLKMLAQQQFKTEIKGEIEVHNINSCDDPSDTVKLYRQKLCETENEWREVMKEAFIRNLGTLKSQSHASHMPLTLYPYLKVLDINEFVDLMMSEIRKLIDGSESYSPTLKLLQRDIGTQVFNRFLIQQYDRNGILNKMEQIYDKYCDWYLHRQPLDSNLGPLNCRQAWQVLLHQNMKGPSLDIEETPWPMDIRQNIGKFLYNIIIHDVKIDVNTFKQKNIKPKKLPAVYKVHRPWARIMRLELKPHPVLTRLWVSAAQPSLHMRANLLPLKCPSAPWASPRAGAYLLIQTPLIRIPFNVMQQWKRIDAAPPSAMYPVLDSLNQLGEVPWVINKSILDLQLQVFRSGGSKKLDIPQPSSALDTSQFGKADTKSAVFRRRIAINRARSEMYSLWCDALYKLSLANHYRDDIFWLPHNIDFRGRVYACPPHLSQLGADNARALLKFANPKPLGPNGLKWLKLHVINLTGTMKRKTLDERLAYAESIIDKILDSANRPLNGKRWWAESEEPWQTLACCMEIANALQYPNPEEYMCGFPVHQDGSCNGLQHYAALGGDSAGAAAVNLAPLQTPQDVYSAVAALVEEMRAKDAELGVEPAKVLENFVRRKVIKQTVMTTVYGVTKFGARLQIAKQLKDIDDFPKNQVWTCSSYLTMKTFDSLREMFSSTKLIQDWFTECARAISGTCGESVEWVTPLGLPVVQPYFKQMALSATQSMVDQHQRPCTVKQKNAFPPNFIHSLDSSHMMLTGLWCQAQAITFISVHDCFWTHPHTVDHMNEICRKQFIDLHSQPILNNLSEYLMKRYSYPENEIDDVSKSVDAKKQVNNLLSRVPSKGDFKLESVLRSVYFFS